MSPQKMKKDELGSRRKKMKKKIENQQGETIRMDKEYIKIKNYIREYVHGVCAREEEQRATNQLI